MQSEKTEEVLEAFRKLFEVLEELRLPRWLSTDLTMAQLKVLFLLGTKERMNIKDLAKALSVGQSATSLMVDRMLQLDLINRSEDPRDFRGRQVRLTVKGREIIDVLRHYHRREMEGWVGRMPEKDRVALAQGLRALTVEMESENVLQ